MFVVVSTQGSNSVAELRMNNPFSWVMFSISSGISCVRLAIVCQFAWHNDCQTIHFDEQFISPNKQLLQAEYDSVSNE